MKVGSMAMKGIGFISIILIILINENSFLTESGTSNQYAISALMSQVSFRRETIGGIINYWLFPQAKDFLKEIWKFCEFSSLCPKNRKGLRWHKSILYMY